MDKYSTASVGKSLKLVATAFMLPTNLLNVTSKDHKLHKDRDYLASLPAPSFVT